jgi:hypothetical protein
MMMWNGLISFKTGRICRLLWTRKRIWRLFLVRNFMTVWATVAFCASWIYVCSKTFRKHTPVDVAVLWNFVVCRFYCITLSCNELQERQVHCSTSWRVSYLLTEGKAFSSRRQRFIRFYLILGRGSSYTIVYCDLITRMTNTRHSIALIRVSL